MNLGDTSEEIIQWLYDNDAQNQPEKRQYGIMAFVKESTFNEHFRIFPNPASETLHVQGLKPGSGKFEIIISDLTGNNLYKSTFQSAIKIDISNFTDGIYFLKISSGENSFVSKFVKE